MCRFHKHPKGHKQCYRAASTTQIPATHFMANDMINNIPGINADPVDHQYK